MNMESQTTIAAQLVGVLITAVLFWITWLKDGRTRKWAAEDRERVEKELHARLEREAEERVRAASVIKNELAQNTKLTKDAHADLAERVEKNTKISEEAFKEANGVNTKLANLHEATLMAVAAGDVAGHTRAKTVRILEGLESLKDNESKPDNP